MMLLCYYTDTLEQFVGLVPWCVYLIIKYVIQLLYYCNGISMQFTITIYNIKPSSLLFNNSNNNIITPTIAIDGGR